MRMQTMSATVTSIQRRNNVEKSTGRVRRYFVNYESQIHDEISTSNRFHNIHVNPSFKTDEISTNSLRGI